jgi:hypothetical protein
MLLFAFPCISAFYRFPRRRASGGFGARFLLQKPRRTYLPLLRSAAGYWGAWWLHYAAVAGPLGGGVLSLFACLSVDRVLWSSVFFLLSHFSSPWRHALSLSREALQQKGPPARAACL